VAAVNRIRRENPALQFDRGLRFLAIDNLHLLGYTKTSPDGSNVILVVVNLDPRHVQYGWVRVPTADIGLAADSSYTVHDLLTDTTYTWHGERNYVRLDPATLPAHIFRLNTPAEAAAARRT
jgi:starch synthase (maltosyl-transferring)